MYMHKVKNAFRKSDWAIGLGVVLFFIFASGISILRDLEWGAYNLGLWSASTRTANQDIIVIEIDDESLQKMGPWPWTRDEFTHVTRKLQAAETGVIGYTLAFDLPQNRLGLSALQKFREDNDEKLNKTAKKLLSRVVLQLNTDRTLSRTLRKAGNVILATPYVAQDFKPNNIPTLPSAYKKDEITQLKGKLTDSFTYVPNFLKQDRKIYAAKLFPPIEKIAHTAKNVGLGIGKPLIDSGLSARPLIIAYGEHYLPSFALLMAANSSHIRSEPLTIDLDNGIHIGERKITTDSVLNAYPFYYKTRGEQAPIQTYSFHEVFAGTIPLDTFKDKTVLIGKTSPSLIDWLETPIGETMPPVMVEAHMISSLLNNDLFGMLDSSYWGRYAAFLIIAIYLMFVLPRLNISTGLAFTSLIFIVLINLNFILMTLHNIWVPLMIPATTLIFGHLLLAGMRIVQNKFDNFRKELSESNRLLGQSYQLQGQLDLAFDKYRKCLRNDELLSMLYNLGLDYERKRQFNKAVQVFQHIESLKTKYRDSKDRIKQNQKTSNVVILGGKSTQDTSTLIMTGNGIEKPMLGRYQLESEIGKGAMGTVYLGSDPKIGRTVAVKTLPIVIDANDPDHQTDIKDRFFREAETAGRLHHVNIVTIYDVGEEHDLAYIAMDYLQGQNLAHFAKIKNLLPIDQVFDAMIQVADALDYAHKQNVVHRDIKPANIIYDRRSRKPTITDFGVACLTDTSKTKTGTILGTPSFMSPEQVAGQKVDGRSDLFSLGVTMYQLLTSQLPFVADSISSLMYKIANEKHKDILKVRDDLPKCSSTIINKLLQKNPEKRYQTGAELVAALRKGQKQTTKSIDTEKIESTQIIEKRQIND